VIVGLALAVQRLPLPGEVKFAVVLTGGVAGSFGLARIPGANLTLSRN
jgi:hypothetical protein